MGNDAPMMTLCVTAHRLNYLTECLISVVAQVADDYNLVLCADSTGDPKVIDLFEEFAPFMGAHNVDIISVQGGTAGITRNAAFEAASTPWVTYLDGDDVIRPDALLELIAASQREGVEIVTTGLFRIDIEGGLRDMPESLTYRPPVWIYHIDPRTLGHWAFFNQMLAIKRDLWHGYPFTTEATNREDVDFMLHQLLAGRAFKIPRALYGYRDTSNSFSEGRYSKGDICRRRYSSGYYARLFYENYHKRLAENFL